MGNPSTDIVLPLRDYHPLWCGFPTTSHSTMFSYCATGRQTDVKAPTTPTTQPLPGITRSWFSLIRFRSPLLSESLLFSLPTGTEMFHFPVFPPHALYIQAQVTGHNSSQVSPFGHPRINARLPTPQGLSQAPTSFIGSRCQGIHHVPFIACLPTHIKQTQQNYKDARVHYPDLKQQPHPPPHRHQPESRHTSARRWREPRTPTHTHQPTLRTAPTDRANRLQRCGS